MRQVVAYQQTLNSSLCADCGSGSDKSNDLNDLHTLAIGEGTASGDETALSVDEDSNKVLLLENPP